MDVDKIRNPVHTTQDILKMVHQNAVLLALPFENDSRRLLLAFAEIESSIGKYNFRYEPAYGLSGLYYRKSKALQEAYDVFGPFVAMSYGPFQIMYCVAMELGYKGHPLKLTDGNESIRWVCQLMNRHGKKGAANLKLLASAYNGGNINAWKSNEAVLKYTQKIEAAYDRWLKTTINWDAYA